MAGSTINFFYQHPLSEAVLTRLEYQSFAGMQGDGGGGRRESKLLTGSTVDTGKAEEVVCLSCSFFATVWCHQTKLNKGRG